MNGRGAEDERLREALRARSGVSRAAGECPASDLLWDLAHGRLDAGQARAIGAHVVVCGECREAMQLARELGARIDEEQVRRPARARPAFGVPTWAWAAAAAVVVIGVAGIALRERPAGGIPEAPVFREQAPVVIEQEGAPARVIPGEPLVLRWTAVPGARYDVTLAREDLVVLDVVRGLDAPEYAIPPALLDGLRNEETLIWQVEAVLDDGRRVRSATFAVRRD